LQTAPLSLAPRREAFIQRLRHWTRERLLFPLGETNPGTGKHRLYDDAAVQQARLLDTMTDAGIPIAKQREVMKVVRDDLEQRQAQRAQIKGKKPDLLLMIEIGPRGPAPYFHDGPTVLIHPDLKRVTILNLTKIFSVPNQTGEANG
jgi:MerR HTH family regulatory protein